MRPCPRHKAWHSCETLENVVPDPRAAHLFEPGLLRDIVGVALIDHLEQKIVGARLVVRTRVDHRELEAQVASVRQQSRQLLQRPGKARCVIDFGVELRELRQGLQVARLADLLLRERFRAPDHFGFRRVDRRRCGRRFLRRRGGGCLCGRGLRVVGLPGISGARGQAERGDEEGQCCFHGHKRQNERDAAA